MLRCPVSGAGRRTPRFPGGFTLIELLVVMGIIAVLISILLPSLSRAREVANTIKCAANLRSVGQAIYSYTAENKQYLPSAYNYRNGVVDQLTGVQSPAAANWGYIHWSNLLSGDVNPDAFKCGSLANGGLPATNPPSSTDFDPGQRPDSGSAADPEGRVQPITAGGFTYIPDSQAPRMAYALNESLCGRNKHVIGFQGAVRVYRNVAITEVSNPTGTILATEFVDEWGIVSGVARGGGGSVVCKSHRPIAAWRDGGATAGDPAAVDVPSIAAANPLRKTNAQDLWLTGSGRSFDIVKDYQSGAYTAATRASRLDWVGRNHGSGEKPADKKSNFLYLDGHVETKSILETVPSGPGVETPWEWGAKPYSITPNQTTTP